MVRKLAAASQASPGTLSSGAATWVTKLRSLHLQLGSMRLLVLIGAFGFSVGCATGLPFVNSTLDFNNGQTHQLTVTGRLDAVADVVASIMTERGAALLKRRVPENGALVLSFRRDLERQSGSTSTGTANHGWGGVHIETTNEFVGYGSLYYVELRSRAGQVDIEAVGLPIIDGRTACPDLVRARYRDCKPAESSSVSSFVHEQENSTGIRANGAREADVLSGLLAEMARKKWIEIYSRDSE
jgi:hypothetical protein